MGCQLTGKQGFLGKGQPVAKCKAHELPPGLLQQAVLANRPIQPRTTPARHKLCRQREAEAAQERSIQEYMRKRREREAADAARKATKRKVQDR